MSIIGDRVREQAMDWKTAPPVHVLSYLVLGSEKDAKSSLVMQEFKIKYILNVTPKCPNHFEGGGFRYKRIAVSDTGSQKLSHCFQEAFDFIEEARLSGSCILIHCMAGISRSVTLTIAYLMAHYRMSMHSAYQFVKQKRPTISPNLNFMGQLVEFERELELNPHHDTLNIDDHLPSPEQERLSEKIKGTASSGSSAENTPEASRTQDGIPFVLKLPAPRGKKTKKESGSAEVQSKVQSKVQSFERLALKSRDIL